MEKKVRHYQKSEHIIERTKEDFSGHKTSVLNFLKSTSFNTLNKGNTTNDISVFESSTTFRPEHPSIVSSAKGKMDQIFLTIPRYAIVNKDRNPYWKAYSDLMLQLPDHTSFFIMTLESLINI